MPSTALKDMADRLREFERNVPKIIQEVIIDNDGYIAGMNATDQLYDKGENAIGVSLMDFQPYTLATIAIKTEKGQPTDRVTLFDEGDFQGSFYIDARENEFEIKAGEWKTEDLQKKYGKTILGLNHENKMSVAWDYVLFS